MIRPRSQRGGGAYKPRYLKKALSGIYGPAIVELEISLDTMETNEPINRREGNIAQADLEKKNARSYKAAIGLLGKAK